MIENYKDIADIALYKLYEALELGLFKDEVRDNLQRNYEKLRDEFNLMKACD